MPYEVLYRQAYRRISRIQVKVDAGTSRRGSKVIVYSVRVAYPLVDTESDAIGQSTSDRIWTIYSTNLENSRTEKISDGENIFFINATGMGKWHAAMTLEVEFQSGQGFRTMRTRRCKGDLWLGPRKTIPGPSGQAKSASLVFRHV